MTTPTADPPASVPVPGAVDLPPGTIASVVTYLEMRAPPPARAPATPANPGWAVAPLRDDVIRYRRLWAAIGDPWLWSSRARMGDAEVGAILADPGVAAFALIEDGRDAGLFELDARAEGETELVYFGLVPAALGRGAGRFMMDEALRRAFARPIRRLFVHTCTLDHPGAVAFYVRSGFTPYRRALEVESDPRLSGHVPRGMAPHHPVIEG